MDGKKCDRWRRSAIGRIEGAFRCRWSSTEGEALEIFGDLLTPEDHLARMDKRIGAKDLAGASRAAARVGSDGAAIIKACTAVAGNAKNAPALLDAASGAARQDA